MTSKLEAFRNRLRRALRSSLAANLFALYGAHFARYLFPLITIPYVVRKLGVTRWGDVAFIQV
ncbi:MAG: flippase, partial [Deltaproteobacteria bacterium]